VEEDQDRTQDHLLWETMNHRQNEYLRRELLLKKLHLPSEKQPDVQLAQYELMEV
jgi:hypothetical protein